MRSISNIYKLAVVVLFALGLHSCKKAENNIDNNQIVIKPYSVFAVDSNGYLEKTNNGDNWEIIKANGGNAGRALATSGENVIWVLEDQVALVSTGNTNQFNGIKHYGPNPDPALNQSMIINVPEHGRIYMSGNDGKGIIYSDSNGKRGTWYIDAAFAPNAPFVRITSFAYLNNGHLAAYDYVNQKLFIKVARDTFWAEVPALNGLPAGGKFFLASFNNKLVLADSTGTNGLYYSNDEGNNWTQYQGIPGDAVINCMKSAFGQFLLVGTAQYGIFRVGNDGVFRAVNNGFTSGANIRNITAKDNIYKNEQTVQYMYAATDKGIFRSIDRGENWILVKPGNYVLIY